MLTCHRHLLVHDRQLLPALLEPPDCRLPDREAQSVREPLHGGLGRRPEVGREPPDLVPERVRVVALPTLLQRHLFSLKNKILDRVTLCPNCFKMLGSSFCSSPPSLLLAPPPPPLLQNDEPNILKQFFLFLRTLSIWRSCC